MNPRVFIPVMLILAGALGAAEGPATITLEEAVERALARNPGIEVRRSRIAQAEGGLLAANGRFDWTWNLRASDSLRRAPAMGAFPGGSVFDVIDFTSLNNLLRAVGQAPVVAPAGAPPLDVQREDQTSFSLGATWPWRNGVVITPSAAVTRYELNTNQVPSAIRGEWGVDFLVPLARGRGRAAAAAEETIARLDLSAARARTGYEIADQLGRTVTSYWDCLAAAQRLSLLVDTERRARELVRVVGDFVRAGEFEPAMRLEADAEVSRRRGDVIAGELELFTARQRLGVAIGLSPAELPAAPLAAGDFPAVLPPTAADAASLAALALHQRGDLLAAEQARRGEETQTARARSDLRPRLDLDVRTGYASGAYGTSLDRYAPALSQNLTGVNFAAALALDWPTANRAARGNLKRRQAALREAEFTLADLSAGIAAEVAIAHAAWRAAAQRHAIAAETAATLGEVLANQRRKLALGETNLTALVQNEDRYFQARTALIDAARNHAVAVLDLRRVTGTLFSADGSASRLTRAQLTTPPAQMP